MLPRALSDNPHGVSIEHFPLQFQKKTYIRRGGKARPPLIFARVGGEKNDGAYSAPYPEPGSLTLDPIAEKR